MPSAKDIAVNSKYLKVFSVGESGTGKSTFASSFPTPGFVFDFGGEIISYSGLDFDYEQFELNARGYTFFEKTFLQVRKDVEEGKYQTVIVDNVSAMTDLCMEKALQLDPKRSPTNGPIWNVHYGMVKNLMEGKLRQFLSLQCNLVLIAHLKTIENETGAVIGVEPKLTGGLSADVPAYFDEVLYHVTRQVNGETKWFVQTVPIGRNKGRSRSSGKTQLLPPTLENDYSLYVSYITGEKKYVKEKGGK